MPLEVQDHQIPAITFLSEAARLALSPESREKFVRAQPFPHIVIDGFLEPEIAEAALREFEASEQGWQHFHHYNENKMVLPHLDKMGPVTRALIGELHGEDFLSRMSRAFGIPGLRPDPDLDGGGLHCTKPGGFLNMHVDFLSHTLRKTWSRQLNLLLFLNKDWRDEYRGHLEFWNADVSRCERKLRPDFNRCVIFQTVRVAWHGHPSPLACPPGRSRKSIALYYFRDEGTPVPLRPTYYSATPGDSAFKRVGIALDRALLRAYSLVKRKGWINDALATWLLGLLPDRHGRDEQTTEKSAPH